MIDANIGEPVEISKSTRECRFTSSVKSRKRIYGEEYRTVGEFLEEPRAKDIKLLRPEYEIVTTNVKRSCGDAPVPAPPRRLVPTPSTRTYTKIRLSLTSVPDVCPDCFAVSCFCNS